MKTMIDDDYTSTRTVLFPSHCAGSATWKYAREEAEQNELCWSVYSERIKLEMIDSK